MHMKTKQKAITRTWSAIALVERELWKHSRLRIGGITEEMAVKTKPPSYVNDPAKPIMSRISKKMMSPKNGQNQAITEIITVCKSR